jgi:glycerophosphoryl diester phosphodiesterase
VSPSRPFIIGHRGAAAVAPENTLASLRAALDAGADRVEFDVRLTADRHPVLMHDATLERTTDGNGPVAALRWEELTLLDAGSWFSPAHQGEPIPDLEDALRLVRPKLPVVVELKSESDDDLPLVEAVLESIGETGGYIGVTVSGKRWPLLREIARRAEGLELALTYGSGVKTDPVAAAQEIGAGALHANRRRLNRDLVDRARSAGLEVDAYTINKRRPLKRAAALGVDGVFTDDPGKIRAMLEGA